MLSQRDIELLRQALSQEDPTPAYKQAILEKLSRGEAPVNGPPMVDDLVFRPSKELQRRMKEDPESLLAPREPYRPRDLSGVDPKLLMQPVSNPVGEVAEAQAMAKGVGAGTIAPYAQAGRGAESRNIEKGTGERNPNIISPWFTNSQGNIETGMPRIIGDTLDSIDFLGRKGMGEASHQTNPYSAGAAKIDDSGNMYDADGNIIGNIMENERNELTSAAVVAADLGPVAAGGQLMSRAARGQKLVQPQDATTARLFAGPNAKTARTDLLPTAKEMLRGKTDINNQIDIWDKTGWYRMKDNNWAFEIDDSAAAFKKGWQKALDTDAAWVTGVRLGDIYDHPKLYAAYPDAADIRVKLTDVDDALGSYRHRGDQLPPIVKMTDQYLVGPQGKGPRETILHEIQHFIQRKEGWQSGSSPRSSPIPNKIRRRIATAEQEYADVWSNELLRILRAKKLHRTRDGADIKDAIVMGKWDHPTLRREIPASVIERLRRTDDAYRRATAQIDNTKNYWNDAGEVLPRTVEGSMDMDALDRQNIHPMLREPVARRKQIRKPLEARYQRYNDGYGASVPRDIPANPISQRTQRSNTDPTYIKAGALLRDAPDGPTLDYGAGLGRGAKILGADAYEPFPQKGFTPNFTKSSEIPSNTYTRVTNLNTLNVVDRPTRDMIVEDIGRVLAPDGEAIITTRGRDVLDAAGEAGPEFMSLILPDGTYQKGFSQRELRNYVQETLGDGFEVTSVPKMGKAAVKVRKLTDDAIGEMMSVDPNVTRRAADMSGGGTTTDPTLRDVLDKMSERMKEKDPAKRIQPREGRTPFVDSDYATPAPADALPDLSKNYPRQPEGWTGPLPRNDRARVLVDKRKEIASAIADKIRKSGQMDNTTRYFYHSDGPLFRAARKAGLKVEEAKRWLKDFADAVAATSPITKVKPNTRNATLVMAKQKQGIPVQQVIGQGTEGMRAGVKGVSEKGYPIMASKPSSLHRQLIEDIQRQGFINQNKNAKPANFGPNLVGNRSSVTVDSHNIRATLLTLNEMSAGILPDEWIDPKFLKQYYDDPTALKSNWLQDTLPTQKINGEDMMTEYPVFADIWHDVADELGVDPAEAQSMGWFGMGGDTNLGSDAKTVAEVFDERLDVTAQELGLPVEKVAQMVFRREIPLMSFIGAGVMAPHLLKEQNQERQVQ